MTSAIRFAGVASLDVDPVACFAVYEGLAAKIRKSYESLSCILNKLDSAPGERLRRSLPRPPAIAGSTPRTAQSPATTRPPCKHWCASSAGSRQQQPCPLAPITTAPSR